MTRPCLSKSATVAPERKYLVNCLASFLVKGNDSSFLVIVDQDSREYTYKQFSIPRVTINFSPKPSLNLEGIISLPFSSIV